MTAWNASCQQLHFSICEAQSKLSVCLQQCGVHHTVWMTTKSLVCVCRILKGGSKVVLMLVLLEVQSFCRLYYAL